MAFVGDGEWSVTAASGGFTPTGRLAEDKGCDLADLSLAEMQSVEAGITDDIFSVLTVDASVASRTSYGGTAPVRVREQIALWKDRLGGQ